MTDTSPRLRSTARLVVESSAHGAAVPYASNARVLSQEAIDKVAASIAEFGFRQPIVVDSEGVILARHAQLLAAQKLGLAEVPVHVAAGLSPAQAKAYRLMDNRSNQETTWDLDLLLADWSAARSTSR